MSVDLGAAFRSDIITNRADRTPRLIYADWLEDHREEDPGSLDLARFIRAQCAAETLDRGDPEQRRARVTAERLLERWEGDWAAGLAGFVRKWEFRSGFVEKIWAAPGVLIDHGDRLLANIPLRALALRQAAGSWNRLMRCWLLEQMEELEICTTFFGRPLWLQQLTESPYLTRLRRLVLDRNPLPSGSGDLLGRTQNWPALEDLTISCEHGQSSFVQEFARAELPRRLHRLDLSLPWNAGQVLPYLGETDWPKLRSLTMRNLALTGLVADQLRLLKWLGQLRGLHLRNCRLDPGPFTDLLNDAGLSASLESLTVSDCFGDTAPAGVSLPLEQWPQLRELKLGPRQGMRVLNGLRERPRLNRLHTLELSGVALHSSDLDLLGETLERCAIRTLILQSTGLDDVGLARLARFPGLASVQELDLSGNLFSDSGLEHLRQAPGCANLLTVTVRGCMQTTNYGRRRLAERCTVVRERAGNSLPSTG